MSMYLPYKIKEGTAIVYNQGNLIQREGSACVKKLEVQVWRPKGRQLIDMNYFFLFSKKETSKLVQLAAW
jgi:hypothetical protein